MSQWFTAFIKFQNGRYESNMETQNIYIRCLNMKNITKNHASTLTGNVLNYKPIDTPIDITHHCSFTTTVDEETMKITLQVASCTMAVPALQIILGLLFALSKLNRTPPAPSFFWESIDVAAQLLNKHS